MAKLIKFNTKNQTCISQINGEDVRCASHEHVVDMIRSSGSLVTMTVVSQLFPNNFQQQQQVITEYPIEKFIFHLLMI